MSHKKRLRKTISKLNKLKKKDPYAYRKKERALGHALNRLKL